MLDELYSYEEDHSDALCPIQREADQSHAGEAMLTCPLNTDEARRMFEMHVEKTQVAMCESALLAVSTILAQQQRTNVHSHCQCSAPLASVSLNPHHAVTTPLTFLTLLNVLARPPPPNSAFLLPPSCKSSCSPIINDHCGVPMPSSAFRQASTVTPYAVVASLSCQVPIPSRIISRVPEGEEGWKAVVHDWEHPDPT